MKAIIDKGGSLFIKRGSNFTLQHCPTALKSNTADVGAHFSVSPLTHKRCRSKLN